MLCLKATTPLKKSLLMLLCVSQMAMLYLFLSTHTFQTNTQSSRSIALMHEMNILSSNNQTGYKDINEPLIEDINKPTIAFHRTKFIEEAGELDSAATTRLSPVYLLPRVLTGSIAVGGAITSTGLKHNATKEEMIVTFPLFTIMLPSFCRTCQSKFQFHFYFAYDYTDELFNDQFQLKVFTDVFHEVVKLNCPQDVMITLTMIRCSHAKNPAWAQNDAMMEAYIDNMEYFYRINDDSELIEPGWADIFVDRLKQFNPENVGVVGPNHHGGNTKILTYDFTHHSHQEIFGFHYPRDFTGQCNIMQVQ